MSVSFGSDTNPIVDVAYAPDSHENMTQLQGWKIFVRFLLLAYV
jgi:hypothetical protein